MAIIKETVKVFFEGNSIELIKGNEIQDSSPLVKLKPELFETKEELLIEAPVAELEVIEVEEPKPKRRKRK